MLQLCVCQDIDAWKFGENSKEARDASPRATLTPLSCSANFQVLNITTYAQ